MKKLPLVFLLIIAILTTVSSCAYSQTVPQKKPANEIFINRKGEVHDHGGTKLGFITKEDIVKNNQGKTLYFIDRSGNVIDAAGKNLGKAQKNGSYFNNNGENIITVRDLDAEKCAILDPKGHSQGAVHKNYKLHACAAHCFWLNQAKEKAKG